MLNRKRLKTVLTIAIVGAIGLLGAVFAGYRYFDNNKAEMLMKAAQNADLSLKGLKHTATKNGIREWSLEASQASFDGERKEAYLENVSIVFFQDNIEKIFVKAEHGTLKTDLNDILLNGNVAVKHDQYVLKTDSMTYIHSENKISSSSQVNITGNSFVFKADSIRFNLSDKKTVLEGNVKGELIGNVIM